MDRSGVKQKHFPSRKSPAARAYYNGYVSLHNHTEFSLLDGLSSVAEYVEVAQKQKMPALAITDHGNMCGAPSFYHACRKVDIEPIIGEEFYFTTDIEEHKARKKKDYKEEFNEEGEDDGYGRYHVVILARGERGYKTLAELSSESHRNFWHKPLIDRSILEEMSEKDRNSLVILSGCAGSVINMAIRTGHLDRARENVLWWRDMFKHFYFELQSHGCSFDRKINLQLVKYAAKYNLPYLVTNDPHYAVKEDCDHHDALLAIQTASDLDDPNRFRFEGSGYHLRTNKEMEKAFKRYKGVYAQGASTTLEVAKLCYTRISGWETRTWRIPNFPDTEKPFKLLERLCREGMDKRGLTGNKKYEKQLKHELKVFKDTNLADFLLITRESIEYANSVGCRVGTGRGSVCGCLVAFLIGIHKVDPIRYDLLFERFLNPARPKMPDIDTDFSQRHRHLIFEHTEEKYGRENVVMVCAYGRMQMRAAFQSIAATYGIEYKDRLRISKELSDDEEIADVLPPELREQYPRMADQLERLSGTKRSISAHPAGVIIASPEDNIRELVPEFWIASSKRMVGQYDLDAVEDMGLMKQDFLGLKTLDVIQETVDMVKEHQGVEIEPDDWWPDHEKDDAKIYKMLAKGDTIGVFQMEGPVNTRGCREVNPQEFEDLVSITSLYRTGPLRAGYDKQFNANRKKGKKKISYVHPLLKPILEDTWGVILYQEQVMKIAEVMAGFDMVQVDDIKEAIKHKKSALMVSLRPLFVKGCKKNGIAKEIANAVWNDIEGYSGYSYNRSHAVAYTLITYQTARLKYLYPLEFRCALLRTSKDDSKGAREKKQGYLRYAVQDFKILPPDINISDIGMTPDHKKKALRFGFRDIKGIGDKSALKLLEHRGSGYTDPNEVVEAVRNSGVFQALVDSTALASIGPKGDKETRDKLLNWQFKDPMLKWKERYDESVELPSGEPDEEVCLLGMITKITKGRTKTDKDFRTWVIQYSQTEFFTIKLWNSTESLWDLGTGSVVMITGKWEPKWENCSVGHPGQVEVLKAVRGMNDD